MSIGRSILAILDQGPAYGLQLKNGFEARTGGIYPLNVGRVYTTLDRLERDGLVRMSPQQGTEGQKVYEITDAGRARVAAWFSELTATTTPSRDELVLKLVMAASRDAATATRVIQAERRAAIELLQGYTRLKRDTPRDGDLGWLFLLDSLIFQTEARVRWLDACEARSARTRRDPRPVPEPTPTPAPIPRTDEVPA